MMLWVYMLYIFYDISKTAFDIYDMILYDMI